jgi:hypothetical protein
MFAQTTGLSVSYAILCLIATANVPPGQTDRFDFETQLSDQTGSGYCSRNFPNSLKSQLWYGMVDV